MGGRSFAGSTILMTAAVAAALTTGAAHLRAQDAVAVQWTSVVNATATGSAIQKTAGCDGCPDAGGTSLQAIATADGYVEFTPATGGRFYAGLGTTTTANTDLTLIDFAFSFWPDGGWDVRERGEYRADGRFVAGDVFRVAVISGVVKYYKNGALVYTSLAPVALPLVLDTTLLTAGASLTSAVITAPAITPTSDPVVITTTTLPDGVVNQAYSASLTATGGTGTYHWTLTAGALPTGVALSDAGALTGMPSAPGTYAFTVRAADATDATKFDERSLTILVPSSTDAIVVGTKTIPSTRVEEPYAATLTASGGSGAFTWTIADGSLPAGLTLNAAGTITGAATVGGRYHITIRATDAADPANVGDRALVLTVLAATPPSVYTAINDRVARTKGPLPQLGPAGHTFNDPVFGTRMVRITDGATRPANLDRSYRTPSSVHTNAWSADGRYFYVTSTDGNTLPFAFDAATMRATRLPSVTGDGGLLFSFFNEPTFSYLTPGVLYGTYTGAGANLRSVDQYDIETGVYTQLLNLDTLAPNLAGTYTGGLAASAGPVERIFAFFGGLSQDKHFYLVVFDKDTPSNRFLVDTIASTVDGAPTNVPLNFKIHAAAIDRSGRYVTIYPTSVDQQAPRSAAPAYIWDLQSNTFTATPLVEARSGGHDTYGYGIRINQDCCTSTTWDAAQWQFRSLETPMVTVDLITPVLLPREVFLADHPSWHNAQPVALVPFLDANYRYNNNTGEWRAWDEEVFAVQTDAPGTGATVWRFAHHRSNTTHDTDPSRISFWYTPRVNVSPDGRWALFTSNWEKTLGTDLRGEPGGTFRQDVFLIELKQTVAPPPVVPVTIGTTALPSGMTGTPYSAALQASGGSGAYTWSLASGVLPSGLSLTASGVISGTPSTAGSVTFIVRATDSSDSANFDDQALTIAIAAPPTPPVVITMTTLPDGRRNVFYSVAIGSSGGLAPLTWSIAAGSLPSGLSLNGTTGTISGTPNSTGTWSFTVRVTDSASPATSDTQSLSIRIRRR